MATSANQWKKATAIELTLPSGNVALCRRPGLKAFIVSGKVPNTLMPMMKGALAGQKLDPSKMEITEDMVADMVQLLDIVVVDCVIEPNVRPVPVGGAERDPEELYIDEVDDEDKNFIFQWAVGGTADIEKFREQTRTVLGAVAPVEVVPPTPE